MAFKSWISSDYSCFKQTRRLLEASEQAGREEEASKAFASFRRDRSLSGRTNVILHCFLPSPSLFEP